MVEESNGVFSREALVEATHDSRRHGLLLLLVLLVAIVFFALGIAVGRWTRQSFPATPPPAEQRNNR